MTKPTAGEQPKPQTEIDLINKLMDDNNVSMNALADSTGIPYATLRRSLKGGRPLNLPEVRVIAAALGVWPSDILPDDLLIKQDAA